MPSIKATASPPTLETALLLLLLLLFLLHQLFLQVQSVGSVAPRSRRLIHLNTSSLWTPPVQPCVPELGRWRERREEEGVFLKKVKITADHYIDVNVNVKNHRVFQRELEQSNSTETWRLHIRVKLRRSLCSVIYDRTVTQREMRNER
ncbi:hypothetical protein F2P81_025412 [Scophthalmus maximus]|uniref:Uncharacterized protein n=1 Tax=Scophthalmus maximus TaxID=52904 RepID=A0A6A4RQ43_SCOMX|nr:hypothetical protein F2P81_025412 [Scophthalmus maximus]